MGAQIAANYRWFQAAEVFLTEIITEDKPSDWFGLILHLQRLLRRLLRSPNPLSVSGTGQVSGPRVCLNWKDPEVLVSHCIEREADPEVARDSSEVPQLGPGLRWHLSAPLSPVSTATSKNSHLPV